MIKLSNETIKLTRRVLKERKERPEQVNEFEFVKKAFGKGKLPPFYRWSRDESLESLVNFQRLPLQRLGALRMQQEDLLGDVPVFLQKNLDKVKRNTNQRFLKAFRDRMEKVRELIKKVEQGETGGLSRSAVKFVKAYKAGIKQKMQQRLKIYEDLYEKYVSGPKARPDAPLREPDDSNKPMSDFEAKRFIKDLDADIARSKAAERKAAANRERLAARERGMFGDPGFGSRRV